MILFDVEHHVVKLRFRNNAAGNKEFTEVTEISEESEALIFLSIG